MGKVGPAPWVGSRNATEVKGLVISLHPGCWLLQVQGLKQWLSMFPLKDNHCRTDQGQKTPSLGWGVVCVGTVDSKALDLSIGGDEQALEVGSAASFLLSSLHAATPVLDLTVQISLARCFSTTVMGVGDN